MHICGYQYSNLQIWRMFLVFQSEKQLWITNIIPIYSYHYDPMLDTCVYDDKHLDQHKVLLAGNFIVKNLSSQVYVQGNRFMLFYDITDNSDFGEKTTQKCAFSVSNNGGKRKSQNIKGW